MKADTVSTVTFRGVSGANFTAGSVFNVWGPDAGSAGDATEREESEDIAEQPGESLRWIDMLLAGIALVAVALALALLAIARTRDGSLRHRR